MIGIGVLVLAGLAGTIWSVRRYEKQIDASLEAQRRSLDLLDRQESLLRRSQELLDGQESLMRRAELLFERLEKGRGSG
jgi:hypothetical protein